MTVRAAGMRIVIHIVFYVATRINDEMMNAKLYSSSLGKCLCVWRGCIVGLVFVTEVKSRGPKFPFAAWDLR